MLKDSNEKLLLDGLGALQAEHTRSTRRFLDRLGTAVDDKITQLVTSRVVSLMTAPPSEDEAAGARPRGATDNSDEVPSVQLLAHDAAQFRSALTTLGHTYTADSCSDVEREIFESQVRSAFDRVLMRPIVAELKEMLRTLFTEGFLVDVNNTLLAQKVPKLLHKVVNAEAVAMADLNAERTTFIYEASRQNVKAAYRTGYAEGQRAAENGTSGDGVGDGFGGGTAFEWRVGDSPFAPVTEARRRSGEGQGDKAPNFFEVQRRSSGLAAGRDRPPLQQQGASRRPSDVGALTRRASTLRSSSGLRGAGTINAPSIVVTSTNATLGGALSAADFDVANAIAREEALWRANDELNATLQRRCVEEDVRREAAVKEAVAQQQLLIAKLEAECDTLRNRCQSANGTVGYLLEANKQLTEQLQTARSNGTKLDAELRFYQKELDACGGYRTETTNVDAIVRALEHPSPEGAAAISRCDIVAKDRNLSADIQALFGSVRSLTRADLPTAAVLEAQQAIYTFAADVREVEKENATLRKRVKSVEGDLVKVRRQVLADTEAIRTAERRRFEHLHTQYIANKQRCVNIEGAARDMGVEVRRLQSLLEKSANPHVNAQTDLENDARFDALLHQLAQRDREVAYLRNLVGPVDLANIGDVDGGSAVFFSAPKGWRGGGGDSKPAMASKAATPPLGDTLNNPDLDNTAAPLSTAAEGDGTGDATAEVGADDEAVGSTTVNPTAALEMQRLVRRVNQMKASAERAATTDESARAHWIELDQPNTPVKVSTSKSTLPSAMSRPSTAGTRTIPLTPSAPPSAATSRPTSANTISAANEYSRQLRASLAGGRPRTSVTGARKGSFL